MDFMELPDLNKLDALITLCRKRGVKVVRLGELEITLGEDIPKAKPRGKAAKKYETQDEPESFDQLSEEEKMFYSVGGVPFTVNESPKGD
jgi:hypothetical protein